jgi:hypothetical protein
MKKYTIYFISTLIFNVISTVCLANNRSLSSQDAVVGYAKHVMVKQVKRVTYSFDIINNSPKYTICGVIIGQHSVTDHEPRIVLGDVDDEDTGFIHKGPNGWLMGTQNLPESDFSHFTWKAPSILSDTLTYNEAEFLLPRKKYPNLLGVTTFKRHPTIWSTFVEFESIGTSVENAMHRIIKLTKGDTIAPTANLAATLVKHPTKTGFYNVNLKVTAKDNYDPLPEIVFTSVTASGVSNSPFNAGAYTLNTPNNVTTGAYPSIITLAADANAAKQYKINYTVTDASDNKIDVSTTVTVPKR